MRFWIPAQYSNNGGRCQTVRRVLEASATRGRPRVQRELAELSSLWAIDALFEVAANGEWLFRSPRFLSPQIALPAALSADVSFHTTNLDLMQYRIARERVTIAAETFVLDAAVPTEPFDQALDSFRLIEKGFLPLLAVLASFGRLNGKLFPCLHAAGIRAKIGSQTSR
jgi:hypothetical protein